MYQPNEAVGQAIALRQNELAEAIVERQRKQFSEPVPTYGEEGQIKWVEDTSDTLSFLAEAIATNSPALFNNYVSWANAYFAERSAFSPDFVAGLEITREVLCSSLPAETGAVAAQYIDDGLETLRDAPDCQPSFIQPEQPLGALAQHYFEALMNTDRLRASQLILDQVEAGTPIKAIYLHVFQPVQREIGRRWQINEITVAQEHYCTAATQMIMSQLYPYIFNNEKAGHRLVATCVGDELHEIGVRMVADFFEMAGWDTYYLGANVPANSIIGAVVERKAEVLAVSVTMTFHVSSVKSLIEQVRANEAARHVKIMVGGYPFNVDPDLWRQVEADGCAPNAQAAIDTANQWVQK